MGQYRRYLYHLWSLAAASFRTTRAPAEEQTICIFLRGHPKEVSLPAGSCFMFWET